MGFWYSESKTGHVVGMISCGGRSTGHGRPNTVDGQAHFLGSNHGRMTHFCHAELSSLVVFDIKMGFWYGEPKTEHAVGMISCGGSVHRPWSTD